MISIAESDAEIIGCFDVLRQLRPKLIREEFVARVRDYETRFGFRLAYLSDDGKVRAVAGFRIAEWLAGGKYLEIEDLVVDESTRSEGYGGELFDWLCDLARRENCDQLRLVSSVVRHAAHRFYLRKGMIIEAHYFSMNLRK